MPGVVHTLYCACVRRRIPALAAAVAVLAVAVSPPLRAGPAATFALEFIGEHIIPSGTRFANTTIGGLSGIDYDPERDIYFVLSDARGRGSRFYTVAIELTSHAIEAVRFTRVTPLLDRDGSEFALAGRGLRPDPESLRRDRTRGVFFWVSEGDGDAAPDPSLRVADANGRTRRLIATPRNFRRTPGRHTGVRSNRGFESLALSPDGSHLYVANESPLVQDGAPPDRQRGAPVRIAAIDITSGGPVAEYAYMLEPVPHVPAVHRGARENGLVELLAWDANHLLALERAYIAGVGNFATVFMVSLEGADDVGARSSLSTADEWRALAKTRIAALETFAPAIRESRAGGAFASTPRVLDNLEGMTFGPEIDGARTLIFVADDNFGRFGPQFTQFLAFRLVPRH